MAKEFIAPYFVEDNDVDTIQQRMMSYLPDDIDNLPGGFPYDFTYPTAIEKSELIQFTLVQTLMIMFPDWSWGEWTDLHAKAAGTARKKANYSSGIVKFNGTVGTEIKRGTVVATESSEDTPSVEFSTTSDCIIGESGSVTVGVEAVIAGTGSNVPAGSITILAKSNKYIASVLNETAITGGTEEESDEDLINRINEINASLDNSFVGNDSDYVRWAKAVGGVGDAIVIPEWNGPGTVKLVVTDSNGTPANSTILESVYNYIMSPLERLQRKAPIGAIVSVVAPVQIDIAYSCIVTLKQGFTLENIKESFNAELTKYYKEVKTENLLKYNKVHAILTTLPGVEDFTSLLLNNKSANIPIDYDEYPYTLALNLTES